MTRLTYVPGTLNDPTAPRIAGYPIGAAGFEKRWIASDLPGVAGDKVKYWPDTLAGYTATIDAAVADSKAALTGAAGPSRAVAVTQMFTAPSGDASTFKTGLTVPGAFTIVAVLNGFSSTSASYVWRCGNYAMGRNLTGWFLEWGGKAMDVVAATDGGMHLFIATCNGTAGSTLRVDATTFPAATAFSGGVANNPNRTLSWGRSNANVAPGDKFHELAYTPNLYTPTQQDNIHTTLKTRYTTIPA